MSEREIRQKAAHAWSCASHRVQRIEKRHGIEEEIHYRCDCGLLEALATEPDLVALLRKFEEFRDAEYLGRFLYHLQGVEDGDERVRLVLITLDVIQEEIEKTVRLTDGGWEWVEEEGSDASARR